MRTVICQFTAAFVGAIVFLAVSAFGGGGTYLKLPESALDIVGRDPHYYVYANYTCADVSALPGSIAGYLCDASHAGETCIQCEENAELLARASGSSSYILPGYEHDTVDVSCKGDSREGTCTEKADGTYFCNYDPDPIEDGCWLDAITQPKQQ